MFKRNRTEAPRRERDGLVSHILLHAGDLPETQLTVTWVDVAPGSGQCPHSHAPEQGIKDEERFVAEGDLVYIPSDALHGIENLSDEILTHVSVATATVDWETFYDTGPQRAVPGQEMSVRADK